MSTPLPAELPGSAMTDEEYGAYRASAALWAGTSVLVTDQHGKVLIQSVDYRDTCLLPGGAIDRGESPAHGAARELHEELGVHTVIARGLAVDWVSAARSNAPASMGFPGELIHVFDGGTWDDEQISAIRLPESEITAVDFVEPARLPDLLSPGDARRALAALRARINAAGTVLLDNGHPLTPTALDRAGILHTPRARHHFAFHAAPVPDTLTIRQSWAWMFAPDGRILLLLEPDTGAPCLPGGTPEPEDHGDAVTTLHREAAEEAAAHVTRTTYIGYVSAPEPAVARVRYAAVLASVGVAPVDTATRRTYIRVLATPEQALQLFDWGPAAADQLAVVHQARHRLGIPRAAQQPVTELTAPTAW
ncbi:NUDIX domain-containing protein [Streptomyces lydicus]|uniref:NUDIX domain-containing protein n=1 Tax=Streptomyces lydicus TaxID=47763 RepID=UPI001F511882|nr:NUDIX domain-containing protein [Streptomyces lydicus]MCZ1012190.1 NUDIX domain-containing protein [Streptomyces lydicus]